VFSSPTATLEVVGNTEKMSPVKAGVGDRNSLVAFSGDPRYGNGYRAATARGCKESQ